MKGGAEQQKSIFVKVLKPNFFFDNINIINKFALEGAPDWEQGSRLQGGDTLYLILKIPLQESFLEPAPISGLF